jgi:small-conductance mechanosensitive channel
MEGIWGNAVLGPLRQLGEQAVKNVSSLLGMLILILLGLVLGWLAKQIVYGVLRILRFDRLCDRIGVGIVVERTGLARSSSYLAGEIVQGLIVLTALLAGMNALGTPLTTNLVERVFIYLPHLLAAVLVSVVGVLVSRFLGRSVLIAAVNENLPSARLLAGLTRFFVMAITVVAALDELGISRTTIIVTFAITFGGIVTAAAIALGLGARDLARDFLLSRFRPKPRAETQDTLHHL